MLGVQAGVAMTYASTREQPLPGESNPGAPPRIQRLTVRNYRVLRDLTLDDITPLTVLLGPNGSGKSTVFDVFAFLSESFTQGLRRAWDRRNRVKELRSRGSDGPITVEVQYREAPGSRLITYRLSVDEVRGSPVVTEEVLRWSTSPGSGRPTNILNFRQGAGTVTDDVNFQRTEETLSSPDLLAVSTLGQLTRHPRVAALRRFITGWYLSYLSADSTRGVPESGPQERLSQTGDNLPNVVQFLAEQHPERLEEILQVLARRIPRLERVETDLLADGRLLLQFKDAPFVEPILSKFASDGTLKMLAYLTVLYDPQPAQLIGVEEPENQLHPRLLLPLAEEARTAASRSQVLVTTHSPFFVNGLRPEELWVLDRGDDGYARAKKASEMAKVAAQVRAGAELGALWMEGFFEAGDPLVRHRRAGTAT